MTWGTNRAGVPWLIDPAHEDEFEASLARGRVKLPDTDVFRVAYQPYALPSVDLVVNVQTDQVAVGERINALLVARSSTDSAVQARVEFSPNGQYSLSLHEIIGGVYATLGWAANIAPYKPSTPVEVRFQVDDDYARVKSWPVATPEPDHWQVSVRTQVTEPGRVGLGAVRFAGNTNTNPEVSFGALRVPNPQQLRVARSVNRVVKPHSAGTDVRLAHPSVVAL